MKILLQSFGDVEMFKLSGRFDSASSPALKRQLQVALDQGEQRIVINMAGVEFVDSTALSTLVQARRIAGERNGDVFLCELRQPVRIIFELTRMDRVFAIFPDEGAALAAFSTRELQ